VQRCSQRGQPSQTTLALGAFAAPAVCSAFSCLTRAGGGDAQKNALPCKAQHDRLTQLQAAWEASLTPAVTLCSGEQAHEAEEMRLVTEAALATPKGQKKDFRTEMPKTYDPTYVEAAMCGRCNAASPTHCLQ